MTVKQVEEWEVEIRLVNKVTGEQKKAIEELIVEYGAFITLNIHAGGHSLDVSYLYDHEEAVEFDKRVQEVIS